MSANWTLIFRSGAVWWKKPDLKTSRLYPHEPKIHFLSHNYCTYVYLVQKARRWALSLIYVINNIGLSLMSEPQISDWRGRSLTLLYVRYRINLFINTVFNIIVFYCPRPCPCPSQCPRSCSLTWKRTRNIKTKTSKNMNKKLDLNLNLMNIFNGKILM